MRTTRTRRQDRSPATILTTRRIIIPTIHGTPIMAARITTESDRLLFRLLKELY